MSRREELQNAGVFALVGTAILVASWRMDRLADRGIEPWSVPGLTPGVVGLLMVVLSLVLALRSRAGGGDSDAEAQAEASAEAPSPGSWRRTALALLLCVLFAGVTLGHGLPFVAEGAAFIFVFTTVFSWPDWRAAQRVGRGLLQTLIVAVLAAGAISWLFESVFLVRLP